MHTAISLRAATHRVSFILIAAGVVSAIAIAIAIYVGTSSSQPAIAEAPAGMQVAAAPVTAFVAPSQGEGFLDAVAVAGTTAPLQAFVGLGQGEGFIGPGAAVGAYALQILPVVTFFVAGQGEGLIDPVNSPVPASIFAFTSTQQGEGLIGPGGGH